MPRCQAQPARHRSPIRMSTGQCVRWSSGTTRAASRAPLSCWGEPKAGVSLALPFGILPGSRAAGAMPGHDTASQGRLCFLPAMEGAAAGLFGPGHQCHHAELGHLQTRPAQFSLAPCRQPGTTDAAAAGAPHQAPSVGGTGSTASQINSNRAKGVCENIC